MNNEYQICEAEGIIKVLMYTPRKEQSYWVLVSLDQLDKLNMAKNWTLTNQLYPRGFVFNNGVSKEIKLHRFLTDCPDELVVDHIDGNTLNNLNSNLRMVIRQYNNHNSSISKTNSTGYKGVSKRGDKYVAAIRVNKIKYHLGTFPTAYEAHLVYQQASDELHKGKELNARFNCMKRQQKGD